MFDVFKNKILLSMSILMFIVSACGSVPSPEENISTAVAQTVQAQNSLTKIASTPTLTPVLPPAITATADPALVNTSTPASTTFRCFYSWPSTWHVCLRPVSPDRVIHTRFATASPRCRADRRGQVDAACSAGAPRHHRRQGRGGH